MLQLDLGFLTQFKAKFLSKMEWMFVLLISWSSLKFLFTCMLLTVGSWFSNTSSVLNVNVARFSHFNVWFSWFLFDFITPWSLFNLGNLGCRSVLKISLEYCFWRNLVFLTIFGVVRVFIRHWSLFDLGNLECQSVLKISFQKILLSFPNNVRCRSLLKISFRKRVLLKKVLGFSKNFCG